MTSLKPGVLSVPLSPTQAVHKIAGSDQPRFSSIRRVLPITEAMAERSGNARYEASQPMAVAPAETKSRIGSGSTSTGNGSR